MRNCQENNQVSVNLEELLSSKEKPFDFVVRTRPIVYSFRVLINSISIQDMRRTTTIALKLMPSE